MGQSLCCCRLQASLGPLRPLIRGAGLGGLLGSLTALGPLRPLLDGPAAFMGAVDLARRLRLFPPVLAVQLLRHELEEVCLLPLRLAWPVRAELEEGLVAAVASSEGQEAEVLADLLSGMRIGEAVALRIQPDEVSQTLVLRVPVLVQHREREVKWLQRHLFPRLLRALRLPQLGVHEVGEGHEHRRVGHREGQ